MAATHRFLFLTAALVLVLMSVVVYGGESAPKPQATCPVMGGDINKDLFVDVQGKRIYVCCPGCLATVKADPAAALKKIAENGETAEDAPVKAPTEEKKKQQ